MIYDENGNKIKAGKTETINWEEFDKTNPPVDFVKKKNINKFSQFINNHLTVLAYIAICLVTAGLFYFSEKAGISTIAPYFAVHTNLQVASWLLLYFVIAKLYNHLPRLVPGMLIVFSCMVYVANILMTLASVTSFFFRDGTSIIFKIGFTVITLMHILYPFVTDFLRDDGELWKFVHNYIHHIYYPRINVREIDLTKVDEEKLAKLCDEGFKPINVPDKGSENISENSKKD